MFEALAGQVELFTVCRLDETTRPAIFRKAETQGALELRREFIAGWQAVPNVKGLDCVQVFTSWGATLFVIGPVERLRALFPEKER